MPTTLILKARKPGAADTARGRRLHPNSTELNETMKVKIKRFDQELPLPGYQSPGAACVDLYARLDVTIAPGQVGYVPLNVALEIPEGCWVLVAARGSTHKHGVLPVQGIGVGDGDFRGDEDEYQFAFYNFTAVPVTVTRGT